MSAPVLQRPRALSPKLAGALVIAVLFGGVSYYLLVYRQDLATVDARAKADAYRGEVLRAMRYLKGRPDDKQSLATIQAAAAALDKMIPEGRDDVPVAQYLQNQATALGIADFKYDVAGGIEMPQDGAVTAGAPEQRLPFSPHNLKGQIITMDFTANYRDFLAFEKEIATSPWMIEFLEVTLRRGLSAPLSDGEAVSAHLEVRYLYQ